MGCRPKPAKGPINGVLRMFVARLLFLCVSVGWSPSALAACPQPATTVFFVNDVHQTMTEAATSLNALAQRLGPQLQGDCLNFALAYNSTSVPLTFDSDVVDANVRSYRAELALRNKVILEPASASWRSRPCSGPSPTSEPEKFQPLVRNAEMQQGLDFTRPDALVATLPPNFPEGQSVAFAAITAAGTLTLAASLATVEFTFEP